MTGTLLTQLRGGTGRTAGGRGSKETCELIVKGRRELAAVIQGLFLIETPELLRGSHRNTLANARLA